jgi:hypothetical protein
LSFRQFHFLDHHRAANNIASHFPLTRRNVPLFLAVVCPSGLSNACIRIQLAAQMERFVDRLDLERFR